MKKNSNKPFNDKKISLIVVKKEGMSHFFPADFQLHSHALAFRTDWRIVLHQADPYVVQGREGEEQPSDDPSADMLE